MCKLYHFFLKSLLITEIILVIYNCEVYVDVADKDNMVNKLKITREEVKKKTTRGTRDTNNEFKIKTGEVVQIRNAYYKEQFGHVINHQELHIEDTDMNIGNENVNFNKIDQVINKLKIGK